MEDPGGSSQQGDAPHPSTGSPARLWVIEIIPLISSIIP
jgi:hypothetical protein